MAELVYSAIASLDGYVNDTLGRFDWAFPDEAVHQFANDLDRDIGTHLYGRRMYEVMVGWEDPGFTAGGPAVAEDYGRLWRAAEKVVFSRTVAEASSARTRIEREFDVDAVRQMKQTATRDLSIGGPHLAASALAAGLVDAVWLIVVPVIVGGGTRWLPDGVRLDLDLVDEHRFDSGFVALHYRARG